MELFHAALTLAVAAVAVPVTFTDDNNLAEHKDSFTLTVLSFHLSYDEKHIIRVGKLHAFVLSQPLHLHMTMLMVMPQVNGKRQILTLFYRIKTLELIAKTLLH